MSTSLGTSRKASPWSEAGRALGLGPQRSRELVAFLLGAAAALLLVSSEPFFLGLGRAYFSFRERRAEKRALAPLVAAARSAPVSYDEAVRSPQAFKDRPVVWCVDHVAPGTTYLAGKPSQPLTWTEEGEVPLNSPQSGGGCTWVVAAVEGRPSSQGLLLRLIGRP
jgi:hypothetical protein